MKSMGWRVPVLNLLLYSYFVPDLILDAAYSPDIQTSMVLPLLSASGDALYKGK